MPSARAGRRAVENRRLRQIVGLCAVTQLMGASLAASRADAAFGFDAVVEKARTLAADTWREPRADVPDWLLKITYDQWRDIRFRPEKAPWHDHRSPFQVQFFHPGLYYNRTVKINLVEDGREHTVEFSPSQFDYGKNDFASRVPQKIGYAGFRVHYPIKTKDYYDEVIVFLGASYFRAVGRDEVFGLSSRALSVDTAESARE